MEDQNILNENKTNVSECSELKTLKYKTMLMGGKQFVETKTNNDMDNLNKFLEREKINNENEPWSKLDKTIKIKKLLDYASDYSEKKNLNEDEKKKLINFFRDCLDKKKLIRVKDVTYDKEKGSIKEIPALIFNKNTKNFTLKNIDKRVSTLKSLAPKKVVSVKNKNENNCSSDEECDDEK
jgi:hypothetical protein